MATVVASKPPSQAQKMKRPPPPYLQTSTNLNGNRTSNPSPSPSSASKRLPGSAAPLSANSQNGVYGNGTGPRPNRQRKESQRMGEPTGRPQRLATRNGVVDGLPLERRSAKRYPEPYGEQPICLARLGQSNVSVSSSERIAYTPQVQGPPAFPYCTSTPYPFSIRSARGKLQLSLRNAHVYRALTEENYTA